MAHKILHILATAQPEGKSLAQVVSALARGLDPHRYSTHAWFLGEEGPLAASLEADGARVRVIPWKGVRRDPIGAWRLWCALRDEEFDITHEHFGGRAVRWLVRAATRGAAVVHLHCEIEPSWILNTVPILVRGADAVIADSLVTAQQVVGMQPDVVYLGVSLPDKDGTLTGDLQARTGRILGTASRLVPLKGIVYLIRTMALLRAEFPDLRLEIAGSGPERAALEEEIGGLGLADRVRFLGWQADLERVLAGWDVFVQPSLKEGFPLAALEAMASGLPVVATSVGGLPELVENGRTGWLVPPADPGALADRLRKLLLNADERRAMGAAGRRRVRERFSVEQMVSGIARVYDRILASRAERSRAAISR